MKLRIGIACLAGSFLVGGAFAADLPVTQLYRPAPSIPQPAVEWTGLYFGVNAGYGCRAARPYCRRSNRVQLAVWHGRLRGRA
jgi:hypothetical protein